MNKSRVFVVLDVGPSTKDTYEKHHRRYVEANEYRGGKTFRELVDEANTPRKKLRKRDKHLIAYNPNPALEFPEKLYDPSLKNSQKWMPKPPSTLRWLKNLLSPFC